MSLLKKILIGLAALLIIATIANYGLSYWISRKLPNIIQSNKDMPYNISYTDLDISLLKGNITVLNASLSPKDSTAQLKSGAYGQIEKIRIEHFSLWALLKNNKIRVDNIIIDKPEIILYPEENKYNVKGDLVKPFKNTVFTETVEVNRGKFTLLDTTDNTKLKASNINMLFRNIKIDSTTIDDNVPVKYSSYSLKCDSLFYQTGKQYNITTQELNISDTAITVNNFKLTPEQTRMEFAQSIPKEKDQYRIEVNKIHIPDLLWGFVNDTLYVRTSLVDLTKVNAVIYRPKMAPDDLSVKKLYSQMLREIKFDLKTDTIKLNDSYVEYQEQQSYDKPAAKVMFSNFNATIKNIYSPINKTETPQTTLDVNCLFMKSSPLSVHWTFDITDETDAFTIQGKLQNVKSSAIDPVAKPLMNITTTGDIQEIYFTFNGNRNSSNGDFAIRYDDLKVKLYKKDGKDKNKLMSAVGNLLVKNDSEGNLKETEVSVERVKNKSVFNFLWRFLYEGLKKTLIPKIISGGN